MNFPKVVTPILEVNENFSFKQAVVVVTTGTYTILSKNSGRTHVIPDLAGNTTLDLPVVDANLNYIFVYVGAADDAHDHTLDTGSDTNFFTGGVGFLDTDAGSGADEVNAGVYSDGNSNSKFIFNNAAAGTRFEVWNNGTIWYINGIILSDTIPSFADQ